MKKSKKILIAGASGFIGKSLIKNFKEKNIIISAVSRRKINIRQKNLNFFQRDLSKKWDMDFSPDYIVFSLQGRYVKGKRANLEDNFKSQVMAIKNCIDFYKKKKCKLIIFLSSVEVYGEINTKLIDENSSINNPNFYGASKFYCESILKESSKNINSLILRLPGILGNDFTPRCWLQDLKENFIKNKKVKFYNPDSYFNNVFDINNLVNLLERIFEINKHINYDIVNLSANKPITIKKIIDIFKITLKSRSRLLRLKSNENSFIINNKKLIHKYAFQPDSTEKMIMNFLS